MEINQNLLPFRAKVSCLKLDGQDYCRAARDKVYLGEGDNVFKRLTAHDDFATSTNCRLTKPMNTRPPVVALRLPPANGLDPSGIKWQHGSSTPTDGDLFVAWFRYAIPIGAVPENLTARSLRYAANYTCLRRRFTNTPNG